MTFGETLPVLPLSPGCMRRTAAALTLAALLVTAGCSAPLGLTSPDDGTNRNPDAAPDGDADRSDGG